MSRDVRIQPMPEHHSSESMISGALVRQQEIFAATHPFEAPSALAAVRQVRTLSRYFPTGRGTAVAPLRPEKPGADLPGSLTC